MKILVTGAGGFIGRRLTSRLKLCGHDIFGLSLKFLPEGPSAYKEFYQQDISRPFALKIHFDLVIHLAAYNITNIGDKDRGLYTAVNADGTRHLLRGVGTDKFIYMSTAKVYKNEGLRLTEESPLAPQGAYEQSKLNGEEECRSVLEKEKLVILRSVNVVGWGQAAKAVLPVFFQKAKTNHPLDIMGAADALMQFVYVGDLIDAIEAAISHEKAHGIFNIAHEETISLEGLARNIIAMTGSKSVLNITAGTPKNTFSPVICDKARQQLGWKAKTGMAEILRSYKEEYDRGQ